MYCRRIGSIRNYYSNHGHSRSINRYTSTKSYSKSSRLSSRSNKSLRANSSNRVRNVRNRSRYKRAKMHGGFFSSIKRKFSNGFSKIGKIVKAKAKYIARNNHIKKRNSIPSVSISEGKSRSYKVGCFKFSYSASIGKNLVKGSDRIGINLGSKSEGQWRLAKINKGGLELELGGLTISNRKAYAHIATLSKTKNDITQNFTLEINKDEAKRELKTAAIVTGTAAATVGAIYYAPNLAPGIIGAGMKAVEMIAH